MTRKTIPFKVLTTAARPQKGVESRDSCSDEERANSETAVTIPSVTERPPTHELCLFHEPRQPVGPPSFAGLASIAGINAVLLRGIQDLSWEWLGIARERTQQNLAQLSWILDSRRPVEFLAAQSSLVCDSLEYLLEDSGRLTQLTAQIALDAADAVRACRAG
jgi:Phasin protein